ncbi:TonB-dependent receptor [Xanthomonas hortorum pv. pelargonii]|nr:TonB-dependent receptor [Xanthomonas hortorum pv. pelargonii]
MAGCPTTAPAAPTPIPPAPTFGQSTRKYYGRIGPAITWNVNLGYRITPAMKLNLYVNNVFKAPATTTRTPTSSITSSTTAACSARSAARSRQSTYSISEPTITRRMWSECGSKPRIGMDTFGRHRHSRESSSALSSAVARKRIPVLRVRGTAPERLHFWLGHAERFA